MPVSRRVPEDISEWVKELKRRWCSHNPKHLIPTDHHLGTLAIDSSHLQQYKSTNRVTINWAVATDAEKEIYHQYVMGIIDAALDRRVYTWKHSELELERARWAIAAVQRKTKDMDPRCCGWLSDFTFCHHHKLVEKLISQRTLGSEGIACWNQDVFGELRYVPRKDIVAKTSTGGKAFIARMMRHENMALMWSTYAMDDSMAFLSASEPIQRAMVQMLRDMHARRLVELIAHRKDIPVERAEQATLEFPTLNKLCDTYNIQRTLVERADPKAWTPLKGGWDGKLSDRDFSAPRWRTIWEPDSVGRMEEDPKDSKSTEEGEIREDAVPWGALSAALLEAGNAQQPSAAASTKTTDEKAAPKWQTHIVTGRVRADASTVTQLEGQQSSSGRENEASEPAPCDMHPERMAFLAKLEQEGKGK